MIRHALAGSLLTLALSPALAQDAAAPPTPSTGPPQAGPTGAVAVRAVLGAPDGPALPGADLELLLVHNNTILNTRAATLDQHGVILLEDLPVAMGVTPVVRVEYEGVVYQTVGEPMDAQHTQQTIEVVCYELVEDPPDWNLHMRHVLVNHGPGGAAVTEVLILRNPTTTTWVGHRDETGAGDTTSFTIPSAARDITLGSGFHGECCTRVENGRVINTLPLMPGGAELSLSYLVPTTNGRTTLHLESPTAIDEFMLVVPADMRVENADEFTPGGETRIADTDVRYYTLTTLTPGQPVHVRLANVRDTPSASGTPSPTQPAPASAAPIERRATRGAVLLGIGGAGLALLVLAVLLFKPRGAASAGGA